MLRHLLPLFPAATHQMRRASPVEKRNRGLRPYSFIVYYRFRLAPALWLSLSAH